MFADEFQRFSGGTDNQASSVLRMSGGNRQRPFEVTMPKLPSSRRVFAARASSFKLPDLPMPKPATVLNIAVIGLIALGAYKLYQKFFGQSLANQKEDAGQVAFDKTYVDTKQAKADSLTSLTNNLKSTGLTVGALHQSLANTLHDLMDSVFVDHDKIVATIKTMSKQTFQLVSVAYGTRELNTYKSVHIFNPDAWKGFGLFSTESQDTLKAHLILVLNDDEESEISSWLSAI
ncbi:MAG: hypothetical protein V4577_19480 [Bacteroidota bacterium]